jgi:RNA polymerase sigma-70 factor (ECF subfamily)
VILVLNEPGLEPQGRAARAMPSHVSTSQPPALATPRVVRAVQRHHEVVWRMLRRMGVPERDADDAAQHVFLTFARRVSSGDAIDNDERYLLGVAVRVAANVRRKRERSPEVASSEIDAASASLQHTPEALLEEKQMRERLDLALSSLLDEQRAIFVLFELEGYSLPEIASTFGIPLGTATSRLRRARAHLEQWLARERQQEREREQEGKR